jgi:hypothetical protein
MSSDLFEKNLRREYLSPSSKWPLLVGGLGFLFAAAIVETRTHDLSRAVAWVAIGCGMILYGIAEMRLQHSRLHWLLALASLVLWFGGAYWTIHGYLVQ